MLRLINAAILDKDFTERSRGNQEGITDSVICDILRQMRHQRLNSAKRHDENWQVELAERHRQGARVIDGLLPRQLTQSEHRQAVSEVISEIGATGIRDRGRVIRVLRVRFSERLDFDATGKLVDDALSLPSK